MIAVSPNSLVAAHIDTWPKYADGGVDCRYTLDGASQNHRVPTLCLLHGYGGHRLTWFNIRPDLGEVADQYGMAIVCPDGRNSWCWDSLVYLGSF